MQDSSRPGVLPYAASIFLGAFLLFQVQPIIAKVILPWFGGAALVWATCMLFFQAALLAGYGYSHAIAARLPLRRQMLLHLSLLVLCLLLLPVEPSPGWKPAGAENPTLRILGLLAATIGLPYLMLSTTSPLLQCWYARAGAGATPYRLFALSNLASMLALLSYPPLVEPLLSVKRQILIWSLLFALFVAAVAWAAWTTLRAGATAKREADCDTGSAPSPVQRAPNWAAHLLWVLLAACPSVLLLAITNFLTQDVASIPFLWVLPLSLYLLSFILCFDSEGWYVRRVYLLLVFPALFLVGWILKVGVDRPSFPVTISASAGAFFVCCMVCHGELARRKPAPSHLTSFYLMIAVGGVCGGLFVGVAAPYLFRSYAELPWGLFFCGLLAGALVILDGDLRPARLSAPVTAALVLLLLSGLGWLLASAWADSVRGCRLVARNFYGELRVRDSLHQNSWDDYRTLLHGAINHGDQWLHPARRRKPSSYYCAESGAGLAINRKRERPRRVGVIGLGAGSLAAWSRPQDYFRFYEINPLVVEIAKTEFTYLREAQGRVDIVLGDARLSLERESPQNFDVLIMDAFTSDAIPAHLVTREAFQAYFRHLKPDGIVAVHISNRYLDLQPVLHAVATNLGKAARLVEQEGDETECFSTTWVLMANDANIFQADGLLELTEQLAGKPGVKLWTDDYSNLFRILK